MAETIDFFLSRVKVDLGLQDNNYHDATLLGYIEECQQYMLDGGVPRAVVEHRVSAGVISRGVSDLWNYGSGGADLSPYFLKRVAQLASKKESELT